MCDTYFQPRKGAHFNLIHVTAHTLSNNPSHDNQLRGRRYCSSWVHMDQSHHIAMIPPSISTIHWWCGFKSAFFIHPVCFFLTLDFIAHPLNHHLFDPFMMHWIITHDNNSCAHSLDWLRDNLKLKPMGFSHVFPMNSGAFPANQCSQQSSDGVGWPSQRLSTSPSSGGHWSIGFTPSVPWRPFSGKMMGYWWEWEHPLWWEFHDFDVVWFHCNLWGEWDF